MEPTSDQTWMRRALDQAREAAHQGEVPVGAVLVRDSALIAEGYNRREAEHDPCSHAEIEVIRAASAQQKAWRLGGTLYVTLEPCPMCVGAILQARIERVVFGCRDPKAGALGSLVDLRQYPWNHRFEVTEGVLGEEAGALLSQFFRDLRSRK